MAAETTVGLTVDPASLSLSVSPLEEPDIARADISLKDSASISAIHSNGGSISVQGRNNADRVWVRVREGVELTGTGTGIFSVVKLGDSSAARLGRGNSGGIEIEAETVSFMREL